MQQEIIFAVITAQSNKDISCPVKTSRPQLNVFINKKNNKYNLSKYIL
ncbi:hypothetical protein GCM10023260_04530 [Bartonella acomydis]|uniref:Uncharacterized protein n=1 Tax=Bartonella acomydis TaxID=686234 RepID=A0ABP9MFT0_9HYPH